MKLSHQFVQWPTEEKKKIEGWHLSSKGSPVIPVPSSPHLADCQCVHSTQVGNRCDQPAKTARGPAFTDDVTCYDWRLCVCVCLPLTIHIADLTGQITSGTKTAC